MTRRQLLKTRLDSLWQHELAARVLHESAKDTTFSEMCLAEIQRVREKRWKLQSQLDGEV